MKRFIIYFLFISFSLFLFGCLNTSMKKTNISSNEKTTSAKADDENFSNDKNSNVSSEPIEKEDLPSNTQKENPKNDLTIVIDPGHSSISSNETEPISPNSKEKKLKDTLGATGVNSKKPEYEITLGIALELEQILKKEGYNVILTKDKIETQLSNIERSEIGNKYNSSLIIRLHCDGVDSPKAQGASVLVPEVKGYINKEVANQSKIYGEKIINKYSEITGLKNRGLVYRGDLTGFNWSKVPIVLLEMGFLSNPKEDAYLSNSKNYKIIANAIAKGIDSCFTH